MLGVLRNGSAEPALSPLSGLDSIDALVADWQGAGTAVELHWDVADGAAVPDAAGRAAFRVVQEALTNATRHAPGASVEVRIAVGDAIVIQVSNTKAPAVESGAGAGLGLVGLDERVRLLGGLLSHGPTADGGFRLSARLPLGGRTPDGAA